MDAVEIYVATGITIFGCVVSFGLGVAYDRRNRAAEKAEQQRALATERLNEKLRLFQFNRTEQAIYEFISEYRHSVITFKLNFLSQGGILQAQESIEKIMPEPAHLHDEFAANALDELENRGFITINRADPQNLLFRIKDESLFE